MASKGGGSSGKSTSGASGSKKYQKPPPPDNWQTLFLEEFALLGHQGAAAAFAGVTDRTVRSWKAKDEDFAEAYDMARMKAIRARIKVAFRLADEGNAASNIFMLKALDREFFAERPNVHIHGDASPESIAKALKVASDSMRDTVPEGEAA